MELSDFFFFFCGFFLVYIDVPWTTGRPIPVSLTVFARPGEDVVLHCSPTSLASLWSNLDVEWLRVNGSSQLIVLVLRDGQELVKEKAQQYVRRSVPMDDYSVKLLDVRPTDNGTYRCVLLKGEEEEHSEFVSFIVVWKRQNGWGLEAEEVGVQDAGGAKQWETTSAKTARAGPSKTARAGPSKTARAGPSKTARAGPSKTARAGPSKTARAGPSETARAGPQRLPGQAPQRLPGKPVLRLVEKRGRRELVPLIAHHVKSVSCIISDEWRAYQNALNQLGYRHFTVNHSVSYVNAETGAHTQHIERTWRSYKETVQRSRGNRTEQLLRHHLYVIECHAWLGGKHQHGPLGRLLHDMKLKYR